MQTMLKLTHVQLLKQPLGLHVWKKSAQEQNHSSTCCNCCQPSRSGKPFWVGKNGFTFTPFGLTNYTYEKWSGNDQLEGGQNGYAGGIKQQEAKS